MKHGWETKRLGDISKIYQPTTISNKDLVEGGKYPVYGSNGIIGHYNRYNHEQKELLVACRGTCGKVNVSKPFSWINGNAMVVHITQPGIEFDFLKYQLMGFDMSEVITGATIPQITRQSLSPIRVAIPPVKEQEIIIAELDSLTNIIELKKKQMKELDSLVQSFFYDMFGDPINNNLYLPKVLLSAVCDKITDGTHDTPARLASGVPFITGKHIRPGNIDYQHCDYVDESVHKEIYSRCNPQKGDVLYTNIGANLGTAAINLVDYEFSMKNVALLKLNKSLVNEYYIQSYLNEPKVKELIISNLGRGGAQKFLSLNAIKNIPVFLPPINTQIRFAGLMENIERTRTTIKSSLKEMETLFNSRMDYWFN